MRRFSVRVVQVIIRTEKVQHKQYKPLNFQFYMTGEQIISTEIVPYYIDGRKKPLWRVFYTYFHTYNGNTTEQKSFVCIDNPTLRRLERFKIERHKHNYLAEIINRVNE